MSSKYTKKVKVETTIGVLLELNTFLRNVEFEGVPSNHFKKALSYNLNVLGKYVDEVDLNGTFVVPELMEEFNEKAKGLDAKSYNTQLEIQGKYKFNAQEDYENAEDVVKAEYDAETAKLREDAEKQFQELKEEYKETLEANDLMVNERAEFLKETASLDLIATHIDKFPEHTAPNGIDQWVVWRSFNLITFDPSQEG